MDALRSVHTADKAGLSSPAFMLNSLLIILYLLFALPSAAHVLLFKNDPRSALGWVIICLMFPLGGPVAYFLFGVNRIRSRARKLEADSPFHIRHEMEEHPQIMSFQVPAPLDEIARTSDAINRRPLVGGNFFKLLENGENAFPAMLKAIDEAEKYIYLTTYIFKTGGTGRQFIDALSRAEERGVDVRVIIDGVGEWYSFPRAGTLLKRKKIRITRFLPPRLIPPAFRINLRNHRKILVTDGQTAFVGGMNIDKNHMAESFDNPKRIIDIHFWFTGPIVSQVEHVFLEDWRFSTGEALEPGPLHTWHAGNAICRAVVDGPNVRIDRLEILLVCAAASARRSIYIMTPYFLPSTQLIGALEAAVLRGVEVLVILPEENNLLFVHWAAMKVISYLLERGIRIFFHPPPFVHTKLVIMDEQYAQIGSANIDPRSFRLNFELMVEIYGRSVARRLSPYFNDALEKSKELSCEELNEASVWVKLRNAFFWLFAPYL